MKIYLSVIFLLFMFLVFSCAETSKKQVSIETEYQTYCGSCHLAPNPNSIPKSIWKDNVLPEMAARMGYKYNNYKPNKGKNIQEDYYVKLSNAYPEHAIIDSLTFWKIHDYIISQAPDSILTDTKRSDYNKNLISFFPKVIDIKNIRVPIITNIQFDTITNQFNIGDITGGVFQWPKMFDTVSKQFNSSIVSYKKKDNALYITEIGILNPSEIPKGVLYKSQRNVLDTIAKELHRPVFTEIVDLNEDGLDEILICEFGHLSGELSILEQKSSVFKKRALISLPGAINLEIKDMNKDGKKDIVVLFSQGNEGIFILYQKDDLQFDINQVIRLEPQYGSSWFQLIDYNKDGHLDIVIANGDNADYSRFLKPYHGIRLFLNDGENTFDEKWFYPIYGATRVIAEDFDIDGDIDFAVTAFFNDPDNAPNNGLVYLENQNSSSFDFQSYTLRDFPDGYWLVMDRGDYDLDGDLDIMLGAFNIPFLKMPKSNSSTNKKEIVKLLLLENQLKNSK